MKISVIVPVYNSSKYLQETLDSIESQTYKNIELFVIDNESTDNSYEIVQKFKNETKLDCTIDKVPNIYAYSWEEPVTFALSKMTGDWFTIIGSDDVLESNYIENYVKILSSKLGNKYQCFQSIIETFGATRTDLYHRYSSLSEFKEQYLNKCPVVTPSVFYSKDLKNDYIPCAKECLGANDYFIYGHLADKGIYIYPIPVKLGYNYRVHENQATWSMTRLGIDQKVQKYWREKWKNSP